MACQPGHALVGVLAYVALLPAFHVSALRHSASGLQGSSGYVAQLRNYSFRGFVRDYARTYEEGSEEYAMREKIFKQRLRELVDFHEGPEQSWKMGVNRFMDFTEAELKRLLGYKGSRSRKSTPDSAVRLKTEEEMVKVPTSFFIKMPKAKLVNIVRDQGSCGSCWAHAAISTLEGQLEANLKVMQAIEANGELPARPTLSTQTIVSCTENPRHCGGTGGCGGATVELAYDMIQSNGGLPFAKDWPYASGTGAEPACRADVFRSKKVAMEGYTILPSNKLDPLKQALVSSGGPIAVSVDASRWFLYWTGIYTDTGSTQGGEFDVNHAVTLMGYQEPASGAKGFWKLKNSWGESWGESGYIRIEMKSNEESHCGWDRKTHEGIACDGDPDEAWVCGTCGILYDTLYPYGLSLK